MLQRFLGSALLVVDLGNVEVDGATVDAALPVQKTYTQGFAVSLYRRIVLRLLEVQSPQVVPRRPDVAVVFPREPPA